MSDADYRAYEEGHRRYEALQRKTFPPNKQAVFDALSAADIGKVVVTFDGSGDSGQVESVDAFDAMKAVRPLPNQQIDIQSVDRQAMTVVAAPTGLADAIETMVYKLLAQTHGGWENDDGAYGDFTFDVADRTITLDYNERYTESTNHTHEF